VTEVPWTPGAVRVLAALRERSSYTRLVEAREAFSAVAADTLPGETVIGRVLRDSAVWPQGRVMISGRSANYIESPSGTVANLEQLAFLAEDAALREGARRVGERHVAVAMVDSFRAGMGAFQLRPDSLLTKVRALELGPAFLPEEIEARWHGLTDANTVAHHKEIRNIDWQAETRSTKVTVWATTSLLDELDQLAYDYRRSPAAGRVRVFNRWLRPLLSQAMEPGGYRLPGGSDTRLRVWVSPPMGGAPDGRLLDAAEELLDRGVPIRVVTADNGMAARAIARQIEVFELSADTRPDDANQSGNGGAAS
jgi:hypothetical protein